MRSKKIKRKVRYIWLDAKGEIRNKMRVLSDVPYPLNKKHDFNIPNWNFDGSSTGQADTEDSDLIIKPVNYYIPRDTFGVEDPNKEIIIVCTVHERIDQEPVKTEYRPTLEKIHNRIGKENEWMFGIEQEFTLFKGDLPLGWEEGKELAPQGQYYCGVGTKNIVGENISEEHVDVCLEYGINVYGTNAEVMFGQWEYQIGTVDALTVSDDLVVSRYLLHKVAQKYDVIVSFDPKPMEGDWNGAGAHTNFSNKNMMNPVSGWMAIQSAIKALKATHDVCVKSLYGEGIEQRLTGDHETASMDTFSAGESNRGASIRIPVEVSEKRCGYLEDRRPCANINPYLVCIAIISSVEPSEQFEMLRLSHINVMNTMKKVYEDAEE